MFFALYNPIKMSVKRKSKRHRLKRARRTKVRTVSGGAGIEAMELESLSQQ